MKTETFEMVAKTFQGLEEVLADELRALGAENVEAGRRMVAFEGDKELMYRANLCCRTALRILKPIVKFTASDPDELYEMTKEYDWTTILSPTKTFSIDSVVNSELFNHSRYVTYRVKDGIVDFFKDRFGDIRPGVRLQDADAMINVHIDGNRVTLSLDSSGESLHRRGYRVAQTEAPINEVLAAGILLKAGYDGTQTLVDPMCGSGTFLIEAALIAANIYPGVYRKSFAFEQWPDFDEELFESLYNDDSQERDPMARICGGDISPKAVAIAKKNIKQAGVGRFVDVEIKPLSQWDEAPDAEGGMVVTNPPYGERISVADMDGLYAMIGSKLKHVFKGYHAWIIGYEDNYFKKIGLTPSQKIPMLNGSLQCELREYVIFDGDYKSFRREGNSLRGSRPERTAEPRRHRRASDEEWRAEARDKGFGGKDAGRKPGKFSRKEGDRFDRKPGKFDRKDSDRFDRKPGKFDRKDGDRFDRKPGKFDRQANRTEQMSENPLAKRRNEGALQSISFRRPSLPPADGSMRPRRGWKRPDSDTTDN